MPEPASMLLIGTGLAGLAAARQAARPDEDVMPPRLVIGDCVCFGGSPSVVMRGSCRRSPGNGRATTTTRTVFVLPLAVYFAWERGARFWMLRGDQASRASPDRRSLVVLWRASWR
jgi:hypothetical protein